MQRRAEFAVEVFGLELGVDGFRLVLARRWALSIGANAAKARDSSCKRAFQLLAIEVGGENLGDPDVGARFFDEAMQKVQRG